MRAAVLLLAATVFVVATSAALADTVTLKNGDRITGTVVNVLDGKVTFKTDALGELKIDLAQIDTLATDAPVDLVLADGRTFRGKLVAASGGSAQLEPFGAEPFDVSLATIDTVNKPPRAWTGSIAGAATWSRGNTNTDTISFDAIAENRGDLDRIRGEAWYRAARTEDPATGDESTNERRVGLFGQYDYFFDGDKLYAYGNLRGERDAIADIDLRAILGAGGGYQILEDETNKLSTEAGLAWFYENYSNDTDTVSDPAARLAVRYAHQFNDANSFFDDTEVYKVFAAHNDYYVRTKGGFRHQLTESFFAQEWVEWTWDPTPADGKERVDVTYFMGIGWSF